MRLRSLLVAPGDWPARMETAHRSRDDVEW